MERRVDGAVESISSPISYCLWHLQQDGVHRVMTPELFQVWEDFLWPSWRFFYGCLPSVAPKGKPGSQGPSGG